MSERVRPDHPSDKNSRQLAGLWRRAPQLTCALPNRGEGVLQNNLQSAANEFLEALSGDLDPKWTEVWAHISLGTIFDITGQSDRAVNEYKQARRTGDNTFGAQEEVARLLKELGADTTLSARIFGRRSLIADLAAASRILAAHGVVDGSGHVSLRHPEAPGRYLMARSVAPALVTPDDMIEYDLDSNPVNANGRSSFLERFIHGEIYKARPDIQSVVHSHSPSVVPFGLVQVPFEAMF